MTHRERFYKVVNHEKADRAVFDLSGSPQTAIDYPKTERGIAALLGIEGEKQGSIFHMEDIFLRPPIVFSRMFLPKT